MRPWYSRDSRGHCSEKTPVFIDTPLEICWGKLSCLQLELFWPQTGQVPALDQGACEGGFDSPKDVESSGGKMNRATANLPLRGFLRGRFQRFFKVLRGFPRLLDVFRVVRGFQSFWGFSEVLSETLSEADFLLRGSQSC